MIDTQHGTPMSEGTREKLRYWTDYSLSSITAELDRLRITLDNLDKIEAGLPDNSSDDRIEKKANILNFKNLRLLTNYRLFIGILILDLTTSVRIFLNAKYQYEGVYAARQIIVIINEGYKQICDFSKNKNGVDKPSLRKNSFWVKGIGEIIANDLHNLKMTYEELTDTLYQYEDEVKTTYTQRSLSVHYYDKDFKKVNEVYDMMAKLDIETIFQKLIPFLNILNKMFEFTKAINKAYFEKSLKETEITIDYWDKKFESLKTDIKNNKKANADEMVSMVTGIQDMMKKFLA